MSLKTAGSSIIILILVTFFCFPGAGHAQISTDWTVLIGVGDSLSHGTMDASNNYIYTWNAYLQKFNDALASSIPIFLNQAYFDFQENRVFPSVVSTNLGVDGSDIFSVEGIEYYKRVGAAGSFISQNLLCDAASPDLFNNKYDKVMYPINLYAGKTVSQLDSAVWLLNTVPYLGVKKAIVIIWAGNNDSGTAALGSGGSNPAFLPIPFDVVSSELDPFLNLLLVIGQLNGEISFEPYTQTAIERNLTTLDDFSTQYAHVLDRLMNETASSSVSKEILLLTLPYYSAVGYLMDSEDIEFYLKKLNPSYSVPPTFKRVAPVGEPITNPFQGDRISLLTFGMMYALLSTGHSVGEVNQALEVSGQQNDGLVLSEAEQNYIMARVDGFNAAIMTAALSYGPNVHVADVGSFLNKALGGQITIQAGNKVLSRKWVRGSAFSLDGVHPGLTGQALVADYLLYYVNYMLGFKAPYYLLSDVMVKDPYIDKDGDGWAPGLNLPITGITQLLFLFRDPDDSNPNIQPVLPPDIWTVISDVILDEVLGVSAMSAEASRLGIQ